MIYDMARQPSCKKVDSKVVQKTLRQSHISITLSIYVHVLPGMRKEAMDNWQGDDEENDSKGGEENNIVMAKTPILCKKPARSLWEVDDRPSITTLA